MDYNQRSPVIQRIAFLGITIFAFFFFGFFKHEILLSLVLLGIGVYQAKLLLDLFEQASGDINKHVDAIKFDEVSYTFKTESNDPNTQRLNFHLNAALIKVKNSRRERDSEFLFFRNIVMHVGIGLLAFRESGKIEIFNSSARKLLKVKKTETLNDLHEVSESLVNIFRRLKTGGRELVRLKVQDDLIQLSVYAIELTLRGENVKLISIQNIQNELEEKEMEAWQNLVRVLTHEIMNSVTPISSLAAIIEDDLKQHLHENEGPLSKEEMQDIYLSLQTISKRSDGLIHFVKEFRSLTSIPKPKPSSIKVQQLLDDISMLYKIELGEKTIRLETSVYPEDLTILADKSMIEQVLINLLKNAIQAFDNQPDKVITLKAYVSDKSRPVISVRDNGVGIEPEALEKIFIPFFTTKKSGSGIGLSLSRQIMREHQGTLGVKSSVGNGTEFLLRF